MDKKVDGWINKWVDARMNGWMQGCIVCILNACMHGYTDIWMNILTDKQTGSFF